MPVEIAGKAIDLHVVLAGEFHAAAIASGQQVVFVAGTSAPDRAYGVEDPFCGKVEPGRGLCRAGGAAAQLFAGSEEFLACRPVDGSIDAASAEQGGIGGVYDGIDGQFGNVSANYFKMGHGDPPRSWYDCLRSSAGGLVIRSYLGNPARRWYA